MRQLHAVHVRVLRGKKKKEEKKIKFPADCMRAPRHSQEKLRYIYWLLL